MAKRKKRMDLNRETAMRLWNKTFGKETKVKDFTGRQIVKGAYNDRKSDFGWNVDHILPQSKGGATADHNLIVCHIATNDEKADKFPCFTANGIKFEIVKVENHYEIKQVTAKKKVKEEDDSEINFMDSASGIRFFKKLKGIQNKPRFVGSVLVRLKNVSNTAVIDFIEKFFDEENISYSLKQDYSSSEARIIARNYNMPLKDDINTLLDKCVLLNTYLSNYFTQLDYVGSYEIYYRVDSYQEKTEMYLKSQEIDFKEVLRNYYNIWSYNETLKNTLYINELVRINTEAKDKIDSVLGYEYFAYDFVFTKLSNNLKKEVSGK